MKIEDAKIVLGIPCVEDIPILCVASIVSLCMKYPKNILPFFVNGSLVYDARNDCVNYAINTNADYLLFVDSDILFTPDDVEKLIEHDADIVSGLYFGRREHHSIPIAYKEIIPMRFFKKKASITQIDDVNCGYAPIKAVGMGFCLLNMKAVKCIVKKEKRLFEPIYGLGEDISFCYRANKYGYKIYLDSNVKLGHIGSKIYTQNDYERGTA